MTTETYKRLEMTERAAQAVKRFGERPIIIEMNITVVVALIGVVQVALRHPNARKSDAMKTMDGFIRQLILRLDPLRGDLYNFLMMGFDPKHDA